MGERQVTDLVVNALVMALGRRMPDGELIHHADHGCRSGLPLRRWGDEPGCFEDAVDGRSWQAGVVVVLDVPDDGVGAGVESRGGVTVASASLFVCPHSSDDSVDEVAFVGAAGFE